jgi:hypothetical protein
MTDFTRMTVRNYRDASPGAWTRPAMAYSQWNIVSFALMIPFAG